jgi:flagellar hook-associated protein 1 FlgK
MSEFAGYGIGGKMLNAMQLGMDVTGHNIANAANPAYSQQVATVKAARPLMDVGDVGYIGGGSEVTGIDRMRDTYADIHRVSVHGDLGRADSLLQGLDQVQRVVNEADGHGVSKALDALTSAFESLAAKPDDLSLRQGVLDAASSVATHVQQRDSDLAQLQRQSDREASDGLIEVNQIAQAVAKLNAQISNAIALGQHPNDLMDERQSQLEKLGSLAGAETTNMDNGMVNVSVNGHWLVDQDRGAEIVTARDPQRPGLSLFTWKDNGQAFTPSSGKVLAAFELRDRDIQGERDKLSTLALALRDDYNGLQAKGYALNATKQGGTAFFKATGASDLQVDPTLAGDPKALAAASTPGAPGDGNQAVAFAGLAGQANQGLGDTYTGALSTWTSEVGANAALAQQQRDTEQASMDQLDKLTAAASGVDLNQQALQLSQYQEAYEAGTKYIQTIDKMMQALLNEVVA